MTNGQGIDLGAMAQQYGMQEAHAHAMVRGFVMATARDLYASAIGKRDYEKLADPEATHRKDAARAHIAARYLAEEVFGIKFEEKK